MSPATIVWDRRAYLTLLGAFAVLHMVQAAVVPIAGDEAYYWDISRRGEWSSFDQPGLVIWSMVPFRAVLGETTLAVRMPAVIASFLIGVFLLPLVRRLGGDERHAARAYLLLQATPAFILGSAYLSTDIAMIAAMVAATAAAMAIAQGQRRSWWWFALAVGIGFLGKNPAVLAGSGVLAALAVSRDARRDLATPTPYLAALLACLCTAPVWIWAAMHDFANFTFQLSERHHVGPPTLVHLGELLVASALLAAPPLFVAAAIALWRGLRRRDPAWTVLVAVAATPFVFFGLVALRTPVGGHWAMPGLVLGIVAVALIERIPRWVGVAGAVFGVAVAATVTVLVVAAEPIVAATGGPLRVLGDRLAGAYGPVVGNAEVTAEIERRLRPGELPAAESYTDVHVYAFTSGGRLPMHLAHTTGGKHGLDALFWYRPAELRGRDFLVLTERDDIEPKLRAVFTAVARDPDYRVLRGGRVLRTVRFYRCTDLRIPEGVFTRLRDDSRH